MRPAARGESEEAGGATTSWPASRCMMKCWRKQPSLRAVFFCLRLCSACVLCDARMLSCPFAPQLMPVPQPGVNAMLLLARSHPLARFCSPSWSRAPSPPQEPCWEPLSVGCCPGCKGAMCEKALRLARVQGLLVVRSCRSVSSQILLDIACRRTCSERGSSPAQTSKRGGMA